MFSKLLELNPLLKECVEKLNPTILSDQESEEMLKLFETLFPITKWGKIDWEKVDKKIEVGFDPLDITPALKKLLGDSFDRSVYVVWDDAGVPIIKTSLNAIIENFYDVTCVSFDTFIFSPEVAYIIEVLPSDKITVGVIPQTHA